MPEIATIVDRHVATVRAGLRQLLDGGFDALADAPRSHWPVRRPILTSHAPRYPA
ncbi:hypothetical protein OG612_06350 [Streptomyces sp. NBC_01527]